MLPASCSRQRKLFLGTASLFDAAIYTPYAQSPRTTTRGHVGRVACAIHVTLIVAQDHGVQKLVTTETLGAVFCSRNNKPLCTAEVDTLPTRHPTRNRQKLGISKSPVWVVLVTTSILVAIRVRLNGRRLDTRLRHWICLDARTASTSRRRDTEPTTLTVVAGPAIATRGR